MDHVVSGQRHPRATMTETKQVTKGYAVRLGGEPWVFFAALEPAYAFGRAGRMSFSWGSWDIVAATFQVCFDAQLERDVRTLFLGDSVGDECMDDESAILGRFAAGVTSKSSHWVG